VRHLLQVGRDASQIAQQMGIVELDVDDVLQRPAPARAADLAQASLADGGHWMNGCYRGWGCVPGGESSGSRATHAEQAQERHCGQ